MSTLHQSIPSRPTLYLFAHLRSRVMIRGHQIGRGTDLFSLEQRFARLRKEKGSSMPIVVTDQTVVRPSPPEAFFCSSPTNASSKYAFLLVTCNSPLTQSSHKAIFLVSHGNGCRAARLVDISRNRKSRRSKRSDRPMVDQ